MAVEFKDYYKTLGVPRNASEEDIKKKFRELARKNHPDVAKNKATAEEKFKQINEAYEVLRDPEKRRRYDQLGANWQDGPQASPPPGGRRRRRSAAAEPQPFEFGGTGFSDFFETYFGGSGGASAYSPFSRGAPESEMYGPGADVEADLMVTLDEVLKGSKRKITLRKTGRRGQAETTETYEVKIPAGVQEGQKIRLAGQGNKSSGGSRAGDLYLRVNIAKHPDFTVQGTDLHCELSLAPWEAVLGAKVKINSLDGAASLRIPAGSVAGSQLRLRGLGLPQEGARGDLYVTLRIVTPATVTAEEQAAWENLAKVSAFKPRPE